MQPENAKLDGQAPVANPGTGITSKSALDAAQLLAILGRISDGVVALDKNWNYTYVNDRAAKMLQKDSPDDLIGKHIWTEYPEGVGQPFHQAYVKALESQELIVFEEYFAPWDKWFENRIFPSADGLTICFSETTTQKKASIALRRAAAVYSNTKDSVLIADAQSIITDVNPAFSTITGYAREEVIGQHASLLYGNVPGNPHWDTIRSSDSWSGKIFGQRKNGESFPQSASLVPLLDEHGQKGGFILIATDMSDLQNRIATEQQLAQAQKMEAIGELTGGVAHDFNNLLAVIMGNLELLRDDILNFRTNPDDAIQLIDAGIDATVRGADLTRNMLSFARRARLEPKDLNLNAIVGKARTWVGRTLRSNIAFETSLMAELWTTRADESSTQSALLNLILNARDAMPDGGQLAVQTANIRVEDADEPSHPEDIEPGRYVMLAVTDTGVGIPVDHLGQIFEPFFSTKPPGSGSGLGLSMVQGFMKQSGGAVQVRSEPGHGTSIKLFFKANPVPCSDVASDNGSGEDKQLNGKRILVAEDEQAVLDVLRATLTKSGYLVTPAKSGDEAREIFQSDPAFDLLLTDIVMPGLLQGTTLARELRTTHPTLPVVFMSGYSAKAAIRGNELHPEDIRLMKPVRRADLIAAVETALGISGSSCD